MTRAERMENWRDSGLILIALLFLVAQILYLLHQMRFLTLPLPWERGGSTGIPIGRVIDKQSMLRNRGQSSLTWFPMGKGDTIHLHDTLLTGSSSWAHLEIQGEGEIDLDSDTLLKFSEESS